MDKYFRFAFFFSFILILLLSAVKLVQGNLGYDFIILISINGILSVIPLIKNNKGK